MKKIKATFIIAGLFLFHTVLNLSGNFPTSFNQSTQSGYINTNSLKMLTDNSSVLQNFTDNPPVIRTVEYEIDSVKNRSNSDKSKEIVKVPLPLNHSTVNGSQIRAKMEMAVASSLSEKDLIRNEMLKQIQEKLDILGVNQTKRNLNVILTTFRSGSTFLGEAVQSYPGTFYHFEPLKYIGTYNARKKRAIEAVKVIRNLLICNYSALDKYITYGKTPENHWMLDKTPELNATFQNHSWLRTDTDFLTRACKLFPNQLLKAVRLPLELAKDLLKKNGVDMKILYLVRDPRGTINSRLSLAWGGSHFRDSKQLCEDLGSDFKTAQDLFKKYPKKFTIARYEDIALHPVEQMMQILEFFGLSYHPAVAEFVKSHTEIDSGGAHETHRDSKKNAFKWMDYFRNNTQALNSLQSDCHKVMEFWGYQLFNPLKDFDNFNALLPLQIF